MINLDPKIIYEDKELLVIDKPSGMIVNKADTSKAEFTLQDWIETKMTNDKFQISNESEFDKRSGIVHRLDKDTSGILIVAKTEESFVNIQNQFKNREVQKKYLALVHGIVEPKSGTINIPIERNPFNRKRFGVFLGGREAVTEYKTIYNLQCTINKKKETFTLLEVFPHTGRTHQIRVHLTHLGHPIVSDILYAGRKNIKADLKFCPRMFLHAERIKFRHPKSAKQLEFSVKLPEELEKVLLSLQGSETTEAI